MAEDWLALLEEDEPAPARLLRRDGHSDFLLTADHAGRAIPRRLGTLGLPEGERSRHIAWDIGIAGVTEALGIRLDAAALLQVYSRLVIDCNRDPEWPNAIPEISETTVIPGNQGLSAEQIEARRREIFRPYHRLIAELLAARGAAGRRTVFIALHSFTPVFKGVARPMHLGVLYNRDPHLARILLDLLRAEGDLVVGDNAPYAVSDASDYSVPVHAERNGLPHVEIELRQDLIAEESGQRAWAERLARLLAAADLRLRADGR